MIELAVLKELILIKQSLHEGPGLSCCIEAICEP